MEEEVATTTSEDLSLYGELEEESSEWSLDSDMWDEEVPRRKRKRAESIERLRDLPWEPEPLPKPTNEWEAYIEFCSILQITPMTMIKRSLHKETLDLRCVPLGDKGIRALCTLLGRNTSIKYLDLSSSSIQKKGLNYLAEMLFANAVIENINFSFNNLYTIGCSGIINIIKNSNSTLRILNLSNNGLLDSQGAQIISIIAKSRSVIKSLNLSNNRLSRTTAYALSKLLRENEVLEEIDLTCNYIAGPSLSALFSSLAANSALKILNLNLNSCSDEQSSSLLSGLAENHGLRELHLQMNRLRTGAVEGLAGGLAENETLDHLDISFNYFNEPEVLLLLESVQRPNSGLRHLDIRGMPNVTRTLRHSVARLRDEREIQVLYGSLTHFEIIKERFCLTTEGERDCALLKILRRAEENNMNLAALLRRQHIFQYSPYEFVNLLMTLNLGVQEIEARELAKEEALMSEGVVDINNLLKGIHILEYRYFS